MSNTVPNNSDGYKPTIVPLSLKVIQGGNDNNNDKANEKRVMSS